MGLYKRDRIWWYSFSLHKKRFRVSTKTSNKAEAIKISHEIYNKYKDIVINKKVSFDLIVEKFLTLNYLSTLSKSSKANYNTVFNDAKMFFKDKDFFKEENLYEYAEYLIHTKKHSTPTVRKYFSILSSTCNEVKKIGFIIENPFKNLDLKSYKKENKRERFLSKEERNLIISKCNNTVLLYYIQFAIETGLRAGEQLNLTWDRIDIDKKEIYITETKTKSNRLVPLTPLAIEILEKLKDNIKPFSYYSKGRLNYHWYNLRKELSLKNIHWHDLRHTFASWAVMGWHSWQNGKPMPLPILQQWLGHSNITMTMRYSHLINDALKSEIQE